MVVKHATIDDLNINYVDSEGSGPTIFLFHGNSSSAESFTCLFHSELAKKYRLIAINFPGHMGSQLPENLSTLSIPYLGKFTRKVIDYFN
ncbi:MAG: alpha/beta hydrolase, partial [Cellvibrionales bacterium]|nr:alpha/beta hydrolase [Cellvibrionales bacterium]